MIVAILQIRQNFCLYLDDAIIIFPSLLEYRFSTHPTLLSDLRERGS